MVMAKAFRESVAARAAKDRAFREALLRGAIDCLLGGDVETGKTVLRDYIKATVGFEKLGAAIGKSPKSLIRMFGPSGNPQARNLFDMLGHLQKKARRPAPRSQDGEIGVRLFRRKWCVPGSDRKFVSDPNCLDWFGTVAKSLSRPWPTPPWAR